MVYMYGVSLQGADHVKADIVCQDANCLVKCSENVGIIAVADGLGSAEYSKIASDLAVKVSTQYCKENIEKLNTDDEILKMISLSFHLAQDKIESKAAESKHDVDKYDTTLTLAILINDNLYYGHSGDGGIIILATDGIYYRITEQQRDEDGCVYPLWFREDKWVFAKAEKKVASLLLATDGMLDVFFPVYIREKPVDIHVALARYLMDNCLLHIDELGESEVTKSRTKFISNIDPSSVSDDKTIAIMLNTCTETDLQPDEYYQEPDWEALKNRWREKWEKEAYPSLYKNEE